MSKSKLSIRRIAVVFTVKDLDRTRHFYAETLNLELESNEGFMMGKLPDGTELVFLVGDATRGSSPQIVFGLEEGGIDEAAENLASQGVQLLTPITEAPGGWSVDFRDPDGHLIALYQDEKLPRRRAIPA